MHRSAHAAAGLLTVSLLTAATSCASAKHMASTATNTTQSSGAATGSPNAPSIPSTPEASTLPRSSPTATPTAPTAPAANGTCLTHVSVLYPGSDNPLRSTCVHVGSTVTITLVATGSYRWTTPTSSAPAVAAVGDVHTDPNGTLHATLTARAPGTTTLSATDTFTPDPHGAPSRLWTLTVNIEP